MVIIGWREKLSLPMKFLQYHGVLEELHTLHCRLYNIFQHVPHICASPSAQVEPGKFDLVYQNPDGSERVEYAVSRDSRVSLSI